MFYLAHGYVYDADDTLGTALVVGALALIALGFILGYLVGFNRHVFKKTQNKKSTKK